MKKQKEGLFNAEKDSPLIDRKDKEKAAQALLGSEDIDISKISDDELTGLLTRLNNLTNESTDRKITELLSIMRELKASPQDIIEALQVHVGLHLHEAEEVYKDYTRT